MDVVVNVAVVVVVGVGVGVGVAPNANADEAPADEDPDLTAPTTPPAISGGTPTPVCAFPSAVWLHGCSGTLVDPQHVVLASHCTDPTEVFLGEDATEGEGRSIAIDRCWHHPGGPGSGDDFAICRLALAVPDVTIVPPLMGCEVDVLQPGLAVTIVGFGLTPDGDFARKHAVTTTLHGFNDAGEAMIGGDGEDACRGDSGGPVFVELPGGAGWRFFGITSYGEPDCASGGFYSLVHVGMPWFEDTTGRDLTPCTDAAGAWDPDPRCRAAPQRPDVGGGDWVTGCATGPLSGSIATCGDPFAAPPDATAPDVAIVSPGPGTHYATQVITGTADVDVEVDAADVDWGVHWVELHADDRPLPGAVDFDPPYTFRVALAPDTQTLTAVAYDHAGHTTRSEPIAVVIDETPPSIPSPNLETDPTCRVGAPARPWPLLLLVLAFNRRRCCPPRSRSTTHG